MIKLLEMKGCCKIFKKNDNQWEQGKNYYIKKKH
jgi:hypothetical protein